MANCGTNWGYIKGCRCDDCTKAHRDYQREYLARPEPRRKHIARAAFRNRLAYESMVWLKKNNPEQYYKIYDKVRKDKAND